MNRSRSTCFSALIAILASCGGGKRHQPDASPPADDVGADTSRATDSLRSPDVGPGPDAVRASQLLHCTPADRDGGVSDAGPVLDTAPLATSDGTLLSEQVASAKAAVLSSRLALRLLTEEDFLAWYQDRRLFSFDKRFRTRMDAYLADGRLPPEAKIVGAVFGLERTDFQVQYSAMEGGNYPIIQGQTLELLDVYYAHACTPDDRGYTPCQEAFHSPFPPLTSQELPPSVEVRINNAEPTGVPMVEPGHGDALSIEVHLTSSNQDAVVGHFGVGFDPQEIAARVRERLASSGGDTWVPLQEILGGWLADKANTFPRDGDNEVCHGPARQFFQNELLNGGYDRSTEATEMVLKKGYCLVPADVEPGFGDYLYVVGRHSGRFILKAPGSGRWISFSVQSGGNAPYRFWWVDEDFSGRPFQCAPSPEFRRDSVDVWRRCR